VHLEAVDQVARLKGLLDHHQAPRDATTVEAGARGAAGRALVLPSVRPRPLQRGVRARPPRRRAMGSTSIPTWGDRRAC
jgi:hypothetical protein